MRTFTTQGATRFDDVTRRDAMRVAAATGIAVVGSSFALAAGQEEKPEAAEAKFEVPEPGTEGRAGAPTEKFIYVGPEGSFLVGHTSSRGTYRFGPHHYNNSLNFAFQDNNYWVYQVNGGTRQFALAKRPAGLLNAIWTRPAPGPAQRWWWFGWASLGPALGNLG